MTSDESKSKSKLRGQVNYIEWAKRFQAFAKIKNWGTFNKGKFIPAPDKSGEAFEWIINNISDDAIQAIDIEKNLVQNLEILNNSYGYCRLKPIAQQQKIIVLIEFQVSKDHAQVFLWLDKQLDILKACGGSIDELLLRRVFSAGLETTLNPNSVFESGDFWFNLRGSLNQCKKFELEEVKNAIWDFWESHRNKKVSVDVSSFDPSKKLASMQSANQAYKPSGKKCDFCTKYRKRLSKSHDTESCFYGDVEGFKKMEPIGENKGLSSYSSLIASTCSQIFYDTGCTPCSYFKDKPTRNFRSIRGTVKTASNHSVESLGVGEIELGQLIVKNVVYVPAFNHNLLSGIDLMKSGYIQIIKNDQLEIQDKDGNVMCTGKYNPDFGLIEITQDNNIYKCHQSSQDLQTWHRKLAHINSDTIKRSLKQYGITTNGNISTCDDCLKGNMTVSSSL